MAGSCSAITSNLRRTSPVTHDPCYLSEDWFTFVHWAEDVTQQLILLTVWGKLQPRPVHVQSLLLPPGRLHAAPRLLRRNRSVTAEQTAILSPCTFSYTAQHHYLYHKWSHGQRISLASKMYDNSTNDQGQQYSAACGFSCHAAEFAICCRICCLPQKTQNCPFFCYNYI